MRLDLKPDGTEGYKHAADRCHTERRRPLRGQPTGQTARQMIERVEFLRVQHVRESLAWPPTVLQPDAATPGATAIDSGGAGDSTNAWTTLINEFTTVQSVGATSDRDLRDAINHDVLPGPRIGLAAKIRDRSMPAD
jgi:hypothetical protein